MMFVVHVQSPLVGLTAEIPHAYGLQWSWRTTVGWWGLSLSPRNFPRYFPQHACSWHCVPGETRTFLFLQRCPVEAFHSPSAWPLLSLPLACLGPVLPSVQPKHPCLCAAPHLLSITMLGFSKLSEKWKQMCDCCNGGKNGLTQLIQLRKLAEDWARCSTRVINELIQAHMVKGCDQVGPTALIQQAPSLTRERPSKHQPKTLAGGGSS